MGLVWSTLFGLVVALGLVWSTVFEGFSPAVHSILGRAGEPKKRLQETSFNVH